MRNGHQRAAGTRTAPAVAPAVLATAVLALAGCGGGGVTTSPAGPGAGSSSSPDAPAVGTPGGTAAPRATPSAPSGPADLRIVVDDGTGRTTTWRLSCDPPGGTHPAPKVACGVLGASGRQALAPVPRDASYTQLFGGAQKAVVTGTWQGRAVDARLSRADGCEIDRWEALTGLLPAGGA